MITWRIAIALCTLLAVLPSEALAGACCMSSSVYGVGRLKDWENAAGGSSLSWLHTTGAWDQAGRYAGLGATQSDDMRAQVWAMARFHARGTAWVRAPLQLGFRSAAGTSGELRSQALSAGDMDLGARWAFVEVGEEAGQTAIASSLGLTVPSGRTTAESRDPLGADVAGRGGFALTLSTALERTWMPWFVRGTVAGSLPLPFEREDTGVWQRFGPSVTISGTAGRELWSGTVLSATLQGTWEGSLVSGATAVPDSRALLINGLLAMSHQIGGEWTLQLAASAAPPVAGWGVNRPLVVSTVLGVRYGYVP
ncbi:MAG: hypothetical protein KC502_22000 [Myxococcales bacterium]|nr:hypothetical protein [Myxococcales bacterium]